MAFDVIPDPEDPHGYRQLFEGNHTDSEWQTSMLHSVVYEVGGDEHMKGTLIPSLSRFAQLVHQYSMVVILMDIDLQDYDWVSGSRRGSMEYMVDLSDQYASQPGVFTDPGQLISMYDDLMNGSFINACNEYVWAYAKNLDLTPARLEMLIDALLDSEVIVEDDAAYHILKLFVHVLRHWETVLMGDVE